MSSFKDFATVSNLLFNSSLSCTPLLGACHVPVLFICQDNNGSGLVSLCHRDDLQVLILKESITSQF